MKFRLLKVLAILCCSGAIYSQAVIGVFEGVAGKIIANNDIVIACNSCIENNDGIIIYRKSINDWVVVDRFEFQNLSDDNYFLRDFTVSDNGTTFCAFLESQESDQLLCYSKYNGEWHESYSQVDINYIWYGYFANYAVNLSSEGDLLIVTYPDFTFGTGSTQELFTDIYEYNSERKQYDLKSHLSKEVVTKAGMTQYLSSDNRNIIISPSFATAWHENQFIHYKLNEGVWLEEQDSFGEDMFLIPPSFISANDNFDKVVFPYYRNVPHAHNPLINMYSNIGSVWESIGEPYSTYASSIVNSISTTSDANFVGIGYTNSPVGSNISGPDSLSYIDLLEFSDLGFNRIKRFNYNKDYNNSPNGITNYVDLSSNGSLLLMNNGQFQWLAYDITSLTGAPGFDDNTNEKLIEIDLFPNPTNGLVRFGILDFNEVKVYNSLGQLVIQIQPGQDNFDISFLSSGMYHFLFYADDKPKYIGKVLKI